MEVTDQIHTLAALPSGEHLLYPLGTRLGGLQSLYEGGREKISLFHLELNLDYSALPFLIS
jgi:hypothetical protein